MMLKMFAHVKGNVYRIEPFVGFTVSQVLNVHYDVLYDEGVRWFIVT